MPYCDDVKTCPKFGEYNEDDLCHCADCFNQSGANAKDLLAGIAAAYFWIQDKNVRCEEGVNRAANILKKYIQK